MLERAIAALAPAWALRRHQARLARERLDEIHMAYEGARKSRRTRNWMAPGSSANAETRTDLATLRNRARDLVRNNPYAAAGLDILVGYQVGTGIMPRSRTGDATLDSQVNALWEAWAPHADNTGRKDIYGLQAQVARTRAEAGEVLIIPRHLTAQQARARGTPVPLALHLLEPDHIAADRVDDPGGQRIQGVELDDEGRAQAYYLHQRHPGDQFTWGASVRVPAQYCLHVFRQDRPGQVRGVPDLAPVMARLRLLDEYEDAALMQALMQAVVAAFVTSEAEDGTGPLEAKAPNPKRLSPGMIERLMPGEEVSFLTPSGAGPFEAFARHQLHAIATGFGLTYDLMTGDTSLANYSSLRAGRLAFKRRLEAAQWLVLVPQLCQPVWDRFIAACQAARLLPPRPGPWPVEWAPPAFEMVDPLKDTMALRLQLRLGLKTWAQAVAEQGWDPRAQMGELADLNDLFDERGLILDGDPRRTGNGGNAQDAAQNAAIEIGATGAALPAQGA